MNVRRNESPEERIERLDREDQERQEEARIERIVARRVPARPPATPRDQEPESHRRPTIVTPPVVTTNSENKFLVALLALGAMVVVGFLWLYVVADARQDQFGAKAHQWDTNDATAANEFIDLKKKLTDAEAEAKRDATTKADAARDAAVRSANGYTDTQISAVKDELKAVKGSVAAVRKANGDTLAPQVTALTARQDGDEKRWQKLQEYHDTVLTPEIQRLGDESEKHARFNRRVATKLESPELCDDGGCAPPSK